jgi:hypothetical protein
VPSANIGELGANEGEVVVYDWKVTYSALEVLPWLALILAFVIPKDNRNYRVLLILISLIIVYFFWRLFIKMLPKMMSSDAIQFGTLFQSLVFGLTILWLIAHKLKDFGGPVKFVMALGVMMIMSLLGILSIFTDFDNQVLLMLALFASMAIAMLFSFAISSKFCRKKNQTIVFMLWLGLWLPLCCIFAMIGFFIAGMVIMQSGPPKEAYIQISIVGLFFGVFLYVINLPYMLLGFVSPFFRERFCACLCLKSARAILDSNSELSDGTNIVRLNDTNEVK